MPSLTQIIPQYDVPHVKTYINDNSGINTAETVQAPDPSVRFICPLISSKGPDGELKKITSTEEYLNVYGKPDIRKYGQAGYMPYVALKSGYASCYCMRVAPKDATIANMVVLATVTTSKGYTYVVKSATTLADSYIEIDGEYYVFSDAISTELTKGSVITIDTATVVTGSDGTKTCTAVVTVGGVEYTDAAVSIVTEAPSSGNLSATIVAGRASMRVAPTNTGVIAAIFDEATFLGQSTPATTTYIYSASTTASAGGAWYAGDTEIADLATTAGITVAGTPAVGDKITVTYTEGTGVSGIQSVKFEQVAYPGIISVDSAEAQIKNVIQVLNGSGANYTEGTGADGTYVLFGVTAIGRGACGNNISLRVTTDTSYDTESEFKSYIFEVYTNDNTLTRAEVFRGSLYYGAATNSSTLFIGDIINVPDTGSDQVRFYVNEDAFDSIYELYALGAGDDAVSQAAFDILFGKDKMDVTLPLANYSVDTTSAGSITFDTVGGNALTAGDEGSFALDNPNRDLYIEMEYRKALFTGTDNEYFEFCNTQLASEEDYAGIDTTENTSLPRRYSTAISSNRRSPAELILDANFTKPVKMALANLGVYRYDAQVVLDLGIMESINQAKTVNTAFAYDSTGEYLFDNPIITRFFQWYTARDPFNSKLIDVTYTYFLAQNLPKHMLTVGTQRAHVGEKFATVTGAIAGSMKPFIDADDLVTKQYFYERRLNTVDYINEEACIQATQITSQLKYTDLSEFSNVSVLLEMKRGLERLVYSKIYDFSELADRARFTEDAKIAFESYTNTKVRSFNVRFAMNAFEEERNILHCYLEVVFRTLATRGIIEIDINSRSNTLTTTA